MKYKWLAAAAVVVPIAIAQPALAKVGDPIEVGDGVTIDPIIDARLRYETVDQDGKPENADAVTMRLRAGAEVKVNKLSFLAEAEGTLAMVDNYDDLIPVRNTSYPVVADPDNVELNRLQVAYAAPGGTVTLGRQRIILDNARFVGNVGWRQNEQTFDAIRGQTKIGPVSLDATYAISQNTIFGTDSPNEDFDGDMFLINAGYAIGPVKLKAFSYLLDFNDRATFSSQTYGGLATGSVPVGGGVKIDFMASYAHQSDYHNNPADFSTDYIAAELGASVAGFTLKGGYEELGSDDGAAAFQTPLATLHAFNGWADLFLATPAAGLRDYYGAVGKGLGDFGPLKGVKAMVVYHKFESDFGSTDYGEEWDASIGFQVGPVGILAKYANFNADSASTYGDVEKFWLQAEIKY